jgi:hypothetical protein
VLPLAFQARTLLLAGIAVLACGSPRREALGPDGDREHRKAIVRLNQRGYSASRPKEVIVMAREDMAGQPWFVKDSQGNVVRRGVLGSAWTGPSDYTPWAYQARIDLNPLSQLGEYTIHGEKIETARFVIRDQPYSDLAQLVLRHIRVQRSGDSGALLHAKSHLGDQKAWVFRPRNGDFSLGEWEKDSGNRRVDALGGWYDAGDYLKFTLTIASTTYYLLRAWQVAPEIFVRQHASEAWPDILDEAAFGLDYLAKCLVDRETFIIQVGTGEDHEQSPRLPENDALDGRRKALCAISAPQMAASAAALALGSSVMAAFGRDAKAATYLDAAKAIFARATEPLVEKHGAFEQNATNPFYRDDSAVDNLGLAAIELYYATNDPFYLERARSYAPHLSIPADDSWYDVTLDFFARAAPLDAAVRGRFHQVLDRFADFDRENGNIWGVPAKQIWGSVPNALLIAAHAGLAQRVGDWHPKPTVRANDLGSGSELVVAEGAIVYDNLDYLLGRNNWGIAMIALRDVPSGITAIYNNIYQMHGEFPLGALAEGPGDKNTYLQLKQWMKPWPRDRELAAFDSDSVYFSDNPSNFQTMETVTYGQGMAAFFFAVLSRFESRAPA